MLIKIAGKKDFIAHPPFGKRDSSRSLKAQTGVNSEMADFRPNWGLFAGLSGTG
jgi:hypothetical protein